MVEINPSQYLRTKEEICQALNQNPHEGLTKAQTHPDALILFLSTLCNFSTPFLLAWFLKRDV